MTVITLDGLDFLNKDNSDKGPADSPSDTSTISSPELHLLSKIRRPLSPIVINDSPPPALPSSLPPAVPSSPDLNTLEDIESHIDPVVEILSIVEGDAIPIDTKSLAVPSNMLAIPSSDSNLLPDEGTHPIHDTRSTVVHNSIPIDNPLPQIISLPAAVLLEPPSCLEEESVRHPESMPTIQVEEDIHNISTMPAIVIASPDPPVVSDGEANICDDLSPIVQLIPPTPEKSVDPPTEAAPILPPPAPLPSLESLLPKRQWQE